MSALTLSPAASASLVLVGLALWGLVHSWLAANSTKRWIQQRLGPTASRSYRLLYNGFSLLTLLPILALVALAPGAPMYVIPPGWRVLTMGLQLVALAVLAAGVMQTDALRFLGLRQLTADNLPSAPFVADGLYRWVRHPLYSGGLLLIWLVPVMTTSVFALNAGFSLYIVIGSVFEERKLVAAYGDRYRRYQQQVPRLIPRPWR